MTTFHGTPCKAEGYMWSAPRVWRTLQASDGSRNVTLDYKK